MVLLLGICLPNMVKTQMYTKKECRQLLQKLHQHLHTQYAVPGDTAVVLQYRLKSTFRDSLQHPAKVKEGQMVYSAMGRQVKTSDLEMVQDQRYSIIARHERQVITISATPDKELFARPPQMQTFLRDTVFQQAQITHCKQVEYRGQVLQEITMVLAPEWQRLLRVDRVTYRINPKQMLCPYMMVQFVSTSPRTTLEIEILEIQRVTPAAKYLPAALEHFFVDHGRQVQPLYSGYHVVDMR